MMRITDPAEQAWMLERLTLRPWKCMEQPLRMANEAAVRDIPQLSINASWPLNRRLAGSAHRATTGERVWEVDTGHDLTLVRLRAPPPSLCQNFSLRHELTDLEDSLC